MRFKFRAHPSSIRNVNAEHQSGLSPMDRLALTITTKVGTMGFFLIIFTWTLVWLGWNLLAPRHLQFDPPSAFVFWLFISNLIQIMLMPLIMVGQNVQGRHAELRAESDYDVNVRAEQEVAEILQRLKHQERLVGLLLQRAGATEEEIAAVLAAD